MSSSLLIKRFWVGTDIFLLLIPDVIPDMFTLRRTQLKDFIMHIKPIHNKLGIAHNWGNTRQCFHFCKTIIQNATILSYGEEPYNPHPFYADVGRGSLKQASTLAKP